MYLLSSMNFSPSGVLRLESLVIDVAMGRRHILHTFDQLTTQLIREEFAELTTCA